MSSIFAIFILFTAAGLIFHCLPFFTATGRNKKENLCGRLSKEGTAHDLVFCSQEILQNKVIGIDGIHRKIMILEKNQNKYNCSVISLDEVQNCELITRCDNPNAGNPERFEMEKSLRRIELQFESKNQPQPASIIFYDSRINSKREFELLKAKAEYWSVMFSKMLTRQVRLRA